MEMLSSYPKAVEAHMPHAEAQRWYLQADIIVDQVFCGTYGLLSVEAMAMGKPVVTYIRDDVKSFFQTTCRLCPGNRLVLSYGRGMLYDENHIYDYLNRRLRSTEDI